MPTEVKAYIVNDKNSDPVKGTIQRRELNEDDVSIDVQYCGICHTDLHQARNNWGTSQYPMVPGHEIIGRVTEVGSKVVKFKVDDIVGVGCFVDSCGDCASCNAHSEQFCTKGSVLTYNSIGYDGETCYGGYSQKIIVNDRFVLNIPKNLDTPGAAPLLCAGVTVYSPLKKFGAGPGKRVAILGLGGPGAAAIEIAKAMGAEVSLFSRSHAKDADAKELGVVEVIASSSEEEVKAAMYKFDIVIDTIPTTHDFTPYVSSLSVGGTYVVLGYFGIVQDFSTVPFIYRNAAFAGSAMGGIKETQEMLDFCGEHNITLEHEFIDFDYISKAYERLEHGDIKYRFVLDLKSI